MFPKPIGTHRGVPGSFNVSATPGTLSEESDGTVYLTGTNTTIDNQDADDVISYELYDGANWNVTPFASILTTTYAVDQNVRMRLLNDYFGTASSYETGTAGTRRATGGVSAFQTTLNSYSAPTWGLLDFNSPNFDIIINNLPTELQDAYNYPGGFLVSVSGTMRHGTFPTIPDITPTIFVDNGNLIRPTTATINDSADATAFTSAGYSPIGTWTVTIRWSYTYADGPEASGYQFSTTFTP